MLQKEVLEFFNCRRCVHGTKECEQADLTGREDYILPRNVANIGVGCRSFEPSLCSCGNRKFKNIAQCGPCSIKGALVLSRKNDCLVYAQKPWRTISETLEDIKEPKPGRKTIQRAAVGRV
jgi:hypothetical protein